MHKISLYIEQSAMNGKVVGSARNYTLLSRPFTNNDCGAFLQPNQQVLVWVKGLQRTELTSVLASSPVPTLQKHVSGSISMHKRGVAAPMLHSQSTLCQASCLPRQVTSQPSL